MTDKPFRVCFTGHQPKHLDRYEVGRAYEGIADYLEAKKKEYPGLRVMVGGARGVDEIARCECVRLDIPYALAIPHVGYRVYWEEAGVEERYDVMLLGAGRPCGPVKVIFVVPDTEPWDPKHCLVRNKYMVDWADEVACVFKGKIPDDIQGRGGTRHTIRYALSLGKPIHHIDPRKKTNG